MSENKSVSFDCTDEEDKLIHAIIARMETATAEFDRLSMRMDLEATNANGCPLDFAKLLEFPAFDFWHDVSGIVQNMDRKTGKLQHCFLPRSAR